MGPPQATLLVLQHIACEPPGAYEDELLACGADLHRVELDEGDRLPDWRAFDGVIAMGGPMGAYDDERYPWLSPEKRWIGEALAGGAPFWGVCLGAQLLAAALGARVGPGHAPEIGVLGVHRTSEASEDPVFSLLPEQFPALQWHADTYELPRGAVQLARSEAYAQQAFAIGRAYGVQFHLEVTTELASEWGAVPAYAGALERLLGDGALPRLLAQIAEREEEMTALARSVFAAWLEHAVGLSAPRLTGAT